MLKATMIKKNKLTEPAKFRNKGHFFFENGLDHLLQNKKKKCAIGTFFMFVDIIFS